MADRPTASSLANLGRRCAQAVQPLRGREPLMPVKPTPVGRDGAESGTAVEWADTAGRRHVRRALEVAAAGSHQPSAVGSTPTPATLFS